MTRDEAFQRLDPELSIFSKLDPLDLASMSIEDARAFAEARYSLIATPPERVPKIVVAPGQSGQPDVELRVHMPPDGVSPRLAILQIHGGGMVMGRASNGDGACCKLASDLSAVVASVEYRLAPETPFPGPLLDCVAAWHWLHAQANILGLGPAHRVVAGDSAGGGLAAALSLWLRDHGAPMPAGQILTYPMLDYRTGAGQETDDTRPGWTAANNQFGWRALRGSGALPEGEALSHFSPALAEHVSGLPPCWIGVGGLDLFLEENIAFAARIAASGGDVTLMTYPGAPHGFPAVPSSTSRRFERDYRAALGRYAF